MATKKRDPWVHVSTLSDGTKVYERAQRAAARVACAWCDATIPTGWKFCTAKCRRWYEWQCKVDGFRSRPVRRVPRMRRGG